MRGLIAGYGAKKLGGVVRQYRSFLYHWYALDIVKSKVRVRKASKDGLFIVYSLLLC